MKKTLLVYLLCLPVLLHAQLSDSVQCFVTKGEYTSMIPLKRLDTLRISVISEDSCVRNIISKYVVIVDDESNANLIFFTDKNDLIYFRKDSIIPSNQKLILINTDSIPFDSIADVEAFKPNGTMHKAVQYIFGAASGKQSNGENRLGFGKAEDVGLCSKSIKYKIDSIVLTAIDSGVAPGIQVLVARYGVVVFHKTYGYHTYDSIQKVQKDDIYDWASITKITSALPALMKLHDENKFHLDETPGSYLPYFKRGNKKELTFRRILSHNAGLKPWIPYWKSTLRKNGKFRWRTLSFEPSKHFTAEIVPGLYIHDQYKKKIYRQIRKSTVKDTVRPNYTYSGLVFYLLPDIVQGLSGENYENYLRKNFYKPLGANTVGYNPLKRFNASRIIPTEMDSLFRKTLLHGTVHDEGAAMMKGVSANAGLFGSALDLAKIMQMYMWKGKYGGERYISENTVDKFTFAHYANEGNRRGLGFDKPGLENREEDSCSPDASMSSFGHSGYTGTFTWADPESGILFIFMSNRVHPTRDNRKLYELNVRPSIHQAIYDAIKE